jgi:hypothetical protein
LSTSFFEKLKNNTSEYIKTAGDQISDYAQYIRDATKNNLNTIKVYTKNVMDSVVQSSTEVGYKVTETIAGMTKTLSDAFSTSSTTLSARPDAFSMSTKSISSRPIGDLVSSMTKTVSDSFSMSTKSLSDRPEAIMSRSPYSSMSSTTLSDKPTETVKNYYLTANYPQESPLSLIERIKVLEALG